MLKNNANLIRSKIQIYCKTLYIKTSLYFIILLFWFDISVNKLLINSFDCSIGTVLFLETMPPKPCFGDKMVRVAVTPLHSMQELYHAQCTTCRDQRGRADLHKLILCLGSEFESKMCLSKRVKSGGFKERF